ncbi:MAG: GNAT family N-acetyltransferase [Oscillospiraceae bacterium]|jgi:RimJ/RimL family protein N-acetyltransferase|nr:GNAT family N-acetyltransferase [Oscillospiraceae bacterium]
MTLQTGDILIRDATADDAETMCRWWNDGAVMAHAGFPLGLDTTVETVAAQLSHDTEQSRRMIIELSGEPIGETNYSITDGVAEIGIKICDFTKQERGIGTACLKLLIDALFGGFGVTKIVLDTNLTNTRAQHVYEKIGFRRLRVNIDAWRDQLGAPQSSVDYELTREEWK